MLSALPPILIAEDEALLRELLSLDIHQRGYPVVLTGDGFETIKAIERQPPAVLLLDLLMPKMDGYGVLEYVRRKGYDFLVIILSNLRDPQEQERCTKLGAKAFLVKSNLDGGDIWTMVQEYLPAGIAKT